MNNANQRRPTFVSMLLGWYSIGLGIIAVGLGLFSLSITLKAAQNGNTFKIGFMDSLPFVLLVATGLLVMLFAPKITYISTKQISIATLKKAIFHLTWVLPILVTIFFILGFISLSTGPLMSIPSSHLFFIGNGLLVAEVLAIVFSQ